jgi:hypothetical protein
MSGRGQSQRPRSSKLKRSSDDSSYSDNITVTDTTPVLAKRQRKESEDSKAAPTMSAVATLVNVPDAVLWVYQQLLPKNPEGIAFLFSPPFSEALEVRAEYLAIKYQINTEDAIEELRRLLAIKAFTVDKDGNKISPTTLSA